MQYGLDVRDTSIVWLNDLDTDTAYKRWPSSVSELLRPAFPGMLRSLRQNLHNLVLVVKPAAVAANAGLFSTLASFLTHSMPVRIGLVFDVTDDKAVTGKEDAGVALVCAFNYVVQSFEGEAANRKGFNFVKEFYASVKAGESISAATVLDFFAARYKSEDLEDVFGEDSDFDVGRRVAREFVAKGGFRAMPQVRSAIFFF